MSLCEWDGWSTGQSNTKKEVTNAAEERLLLSHKLTLEELYEWTEPWLVCLYLSVFFFHPLCISLSICLFLYLSLWPFVSEQLCGCAYIKCNPAGQWERYKERELLLPLLPPINYYSLCLFFLLFPVLSCCFTHNHCDLHTEMRGGGERKTQMSKSTNMNKWGNRGRFEAEELKQEYLWQKNVKKEWW